MKSETAGVVVIYNPELNVFDNISSYVNQVSKLYIIDNSHGINNTLVERLKCFKTAEYIYNNSNIGIAAALNIGARKATTEGFDFLLTMDQDSVASSEMVKTLTEVMVSSDKIGIVAAEHVNLDVREIPKEKFTTEILYTMTSGNLLNLAAYLAAGGFKEELFIDHVDHEYCLRLNSRGFKSNKNK